MYSHVWWSSRFWISSLIAFFHCLKYTGFTTAYLYIFGSYTLLLVSIADITFSNIVVMGVTMVELSIATPPTSVGFLFANSPKFLDVKVGYAENLCGCLYSCGSSVGAFCLSPMVALSRLRFSGFSMKSLASCSDLSL